MVALQTGLFSGTAVMYTLAALAYVLLLFRQEFTVAARWGTRIGWVAHTAALLFLVFHSHRLPIYSLFEAIILVSWLLSTNYLLYELTQQSAAAGSVVVPLLFVLTVGALVMPKGVLGYGDEVSGYLTVSLVTWHVAISLLAYGFLCAAFVSGFLYLVQYRQLRAKSFSPAYSGSPALQTLDIWGYRFTIIGFALLSVGIVAGLIFARLRWGNFGLTDPKVLWSLFTWVLYLGYLLMRRRANWGGRRAAVWSVSGFIAVVLNLLVVGVFLSSWHRFGI